MIKGLQAVVTFDGDWSFWPGHPGGSPFILIGETSTRTKLPSGNAAELENLPTLQETITAAAGFLLFAAKEYGGTDPKCFDYHVRVVKAWIIKKEFGDGSTIYYGGQYGKWTQDQAKAHQFTTEDEAQTVNVDVRARTVFGSLDGPLSEGGPAKIEEGPTVSAVFEEGEAA
jgi:hypothetical protein